MRTKRMLIWAMSAVVALASSFALATTQRTFVAASGVDNSTCSLNSPCRTFAAAMNATNANGEIIVLESAGYGSVTITKAVSIVAPPGIYGGISVFTGNGITIDAPGATVVLRGLSINGQGGSYGILAVQAAKVRVENCVVSGMGAVGVYHTAPGGEMIVLDTIVRDNADGLGLVAAGNATIQLSHVRSEHNQNAGFYIAPAAPPSGSPSATIVDSAFTNIGLNGIWADTIDGASTYIDVERSVISESGHEGFKTTAGGLTARIYGSLKQNAFSHNAKDDVYVLTTFGDAIVTLVGNNMIGPSSGYGITADGAGAQIVIDGNSSWARLISCLNGAILWTYRNNSSVVPNCPNPSVLPVTGV